MPLPRDRQVLYLSQTGMTEPLGQSQVVPYVKGLARLGWHIELIASEPAAAAPSDVEAVAADLAAAGVGYRAASRSPAHDRLTKLRETAASVWRAARASLRSRPRIVHARSYVPGAVADLARRASPGSRFLFDCRGLLPDEYADFGWWRRDSLNYRGLKLVERHLFGAAHGVVSLTERLRRWLVEEQRWVEPERPFEVIPCCVDLDRFRPDPDARAAFRARLGITGDELVLAYAGTLGSWYCEEEMALLYAALRRHRPARLAIFSRSSAEALRGHLGRLGVPESEVRALAVAPAEMPRALGAADAGVSFARPSLSKIASSPVKVPEYLALGLAVVLNRGVGDQDELIDRVPAAVDAGRLDRDEIERAARALADRRFDEAERTAARAAARERFCLHEVGIRRYQRIYERLARP